MSVSWWEDGTMGGYDPSSLTFNPVLYKFSTTGTAMSGLNGVTRAQHPPWGVSEVVAPLTISRDETLAAEAQGRFVGANLYMVSDYALRNQAGVWETTPSLWLIREAARSYGFGWRSHQVAHTAAFGDFELQKNFLFQFPDIPSHLLLPNEKFWFLLTAMLRPANGSGEWKKDIDLVNSPHVNKIGRCITVVGNRKPRKPVLSGLSSASETVFESNAMFTLSLVSGNDPDASGSNPTYPWANEDRAGVEVQYSPVEGRRDWRPLPFADSGGILRKNWWIRGAAQNGPYEALNSLVSDGSVPVKAGTNTPAAGAGHLPPGRWVVRMRTFDFGHPFPLTALPWGETDPNVITPGRGEWRGNASPWSDEYPITVNTQVVPPLIIAPRDGYAYTGGQPVELIWKHRSAALPPFGQQAAAVEIRGGGGGWYGVLFKNTHAQRLVLRPSVDPIAVEPEEPEPGTGNPWTSYRGTLSTVSGNPPTAVYAGTQAFLFSPSARDTGDPTNLSRFDRRLGINMPQVFNSVHRVSAQVRLESGAGSFRIELRSYYGTLPLSTSTSETVTLTGAWKPVHVSGSAHFLADRVEARFIPVPTDNTANQPSVRVDDVRIYNEPGEPSTEYFTYDLAPGTEYEWRVMTMDTNGEWSPWSETGRFWVVEPPEQPEPNPPGDSIDAATLGCGTHRAFIYRRGGSHRVGEITGLTNVSWERIRDDISAASIRVQDWDIDCGNLLAKLQPWAYELVLFRNNGFGSERVWEGPITGITYERETVTISAKDMLGYLYRRIIRQEMNDAITPTGRSCVDRGRRIIQNAFAPDDPNVLRHLQIIQSEDDAKQRRSIPPYSRTAFEELDDMAANSGLDYTCVGRKIIVWGTRNRVGTLPELRDEDLGNAPIVSLYGMSTATRYVLSDGNGIYGLADAEGANEGVTKDYGLVEILSSTWSAEGEENPQTATEEDRQRKIESFRQIARRAMESRYPPPEVVRVPDNTSLNPGTPLSIQSLVPGVAIPLRSHGTLREVRATQKLDSVRVSEDNGSESIQITLSPFSRQDNEMGEEPS